MADFHRLAHIQGVFDDNTLQLDGAYASTTAVVDGNPYLFAAGYDEGISAFSIADDGTLANVSNAAGDADLSGIASLATAEVDGTTYLFAAGESSDSVRIFSVGSDGALSTIDTIVDTGTIELDEASSLTTVTVSGTSYLIVAGSGDSGVSTFQINAGGTLTSVDNVNDGGGEDFNLNFVDAITTAEVNSATYLFAAGTDDGISVFEVQSGGRSITSAISSTAPIRASTFPK